MKKYDFIKCKKCGQPLNKLIYGSLSADYKPEKYTRTAGCCKTDYTYECSNPDCKTKYKDKNIFITLPFLSIVKLGLKKGFKKGFDENNEK